MTQHGTKNKIESCWAQDLPVYTLIHQDKHSREKKANGQIQMHTCTQFLTGIILLIMMAAAMKEQPVLSILGVV